MLGLIIKYILLGYHHYYQGIFTPRKFHQTHIQQPSIFLIICVICQYLGHFTQMRHFGFETTTWYWHFVDVVWLFLCIVQT
jgi:cytochrome c oxidase subunit 3